MGARPKTPNAIAPSPTSFPADVYGHPMHVGRGGWTWYTGSAGWMYQAAVRALLGLRRMGSTISVDPCIPTVWPQCTLTWNIDGTRYRFTVLNPEHRSRGIASLMLDGHALDALAIPLHRDGEEHDVTIVLGSVARTETPMTPTGLASE